MTLKSATDILTGDAGTLITRLLILVALGWGGVNQIDTKDNTEDIKKTLHEITIKQAVMEQRVTRNEILDGSDHSRLQVQVEQQRKDLQEFKETYYKSNSF